MSIEKDVRELLEKGVITEDVAKNISAYYHHQEQNSSSKMLLLFSVLGATLIGLGIILMIAHNWDNFSRYFKTILSILPILIGQGLCIYSYFKKPSWMEASSIFLSLSIGASMTLIAQVYHIASNENAFFFTWSVLTLPILLIQRTQITSLLCLILATAFGLSHSQYQNDYPLLFFWIFYAFIIYCYLQINKSSPSSFYKRSFIWLLVIAPLIVVFNHVDKNPELLFVVYFLVFNIYFILSQHSLVTKKISRTHALKYIGLIGMNTILVILSFHHFWRNSHDLTLKFGSELILIFIFFGISLIYYFRNEHRTTELNLYLFLKIPFILIFMTIYFSEIGFFLMNILALLVSIYTIQQGLKNYSLSITNIGLLTLGALILSRFFDSEFSFIVRGTVFIFIGAGFLLTNYFMLKNQKKHAA